MKICVYGAGAIGGLIAAKISAAGQSVSIIARGDTLRALKDNGICLQSDLNCKTYYAVNATDRPEELGVQDLIIISVKQPSLENIADKISPILGRKTKVLIAMNGLPWWFLDGLTSSPENKLLKTLDPKGTLREQIPSNQIIGCVIHIACSCPNPGVSQHKAGNHLIIGQPDGILSEALAEVQNLLSTSRFEVTKSKNIQADIWFKLWGNMTMNPISVLTRTTTDKILDDVFVNEFCCRVMSEAAHIGNKIGCVVNQSPEQRNLVTRKLGAMKTSMLQDAEKDNPLEYEALIGAVHELACKLEINTPNLTALYGLIRLYARNN